MPGSDSDSSSEDEKVKQLLEAADFSLINDSLFGKVDKKAPGEFGRKSIL
jgi:hypothetical protein